MSSVTSGSAVRSRQQYHPWAVMPAFVSPPGLPVRFSFIQIALPRISGGDWREPEAQAVSMARRDMRLAEARQAGLW